jgi:putative peptidoglycan lipid II flippase
MNRGLWLGGLAATQLLAAIVTQVLVVALVGPGARTDALIAAQTIPLLLVSVLGAPLVTAWQPRFALAAPDGGRYGAELGRAQGQSLLLTGGLAMACGLSAPWWMQWAFPGLEPDAGRLSAHLAQILCIGVPLNAQSLLLAAAARARDRFVAPELVQASIAVLAALGALWVVPKYDVTGAAWLSTGRAILACLAMYVVAGRSAPQLIAAIRDRESWRTLRPMLAGSSIYKFGPLVDRYWASHAPVGGLTALGLASLAVGSTAQVIERAITVPATPHLAVLAAERRHVDLLSRVRQVLRLNLAMSLGILVAVMLLKPWLVGALGLLKFDTTIALQVWWFSVLLTGFLYVASCGSLPVAAFVALGDARTPVAISVVAFVSGVALKSLGFVVGGLPALCLATSIYYVGNLLAVSGALRRRLHAGR